MQQTSHTMSRIEVFRCAAMVCIILPAMCVASELNAKAQVRELAEPIMRYKVCAAGLAITVRTNGCTSKDDFVLSNKDGNVTLTRNVPDSCKGFFPAGTVLFWSWGEVGSNGRKFRAITNPIVER